MAKILLVAFLTLLLPAHAGRWVAGDFHVHSTGASDDTGKHSFPEDIKKVALERGLSFVMLSDHSNAMGKGENTGPDFPYWQKALELTEPGKFIMVDSVEISPLKMSGAGHVNFVPKVLTEVVPGVGFIDRPAGKVTGKMAVDQAKWLGGLAIVNHPYSAAGTWIEYDWTSFDYDALEIYNGGLLYDKGDFKSTYAFFCDLANGKKTFPIGGSDNHRAYTPLPGTLLNSALGFVRTWVYVERLSWADIVKALEMGKIVVGDGQNFVQVFAEDRSIGETLHWKKAKRFRVRWKGFSETQNVFRLLYIERDSCRDTRQKNRSFHIKPSVLFQKKVNKGDFAGEVELSVGKNGALIGFLGKPHRGRQSRNIAITNAIWIALEP